MAKKNKRIIFETHCFECGEKIKGRFFYTNPDGHEICDNCYNENYETCGDCEEIFKFGEKCPNGCK